MDIWAWVHEKADFLREAGEYRLAEIIDDISHYSCSSQHSKVDALYAEGLSLAQKLQETWVEVFIRHWFLQSQVLDRCNAKGMLSEAIELLELSHREEARGCPQRVCAVQDLSNCYGVADGPGYVDERLAVSSETLAEIDPNWSCYICIGSEYLDALYDAERYKEVIDEYARLKLELARHDKLEEKTVNYLDHCEARALIALERSEDAVNMLRSKKISTNDGTGGKSTKILISLALAHARRFDEISEVMLSNEDVFKSHRYFNDWAEIQQILVREGRVLFCDELAQSLLDTSSRLVEHGSYRQALKQLVILAELGLENGFQFSARIAIEKIPNVISNLNKDLGATDTLKRLRTKLDTCHDSINQIFDNINELLEFDFESNDMYAQALTQYCQQQPDDIEAVARLANLFADYTDVESGYAMLSEKYVEATNDVSLHRAYAKFIFQHQGIDAFISKFQSDLGKKIDGGLLQNLWWLFGLAYRNSEPEKAIEYFEKYLDENKNNLAALNNLAWLYCDNEDYGRSVERWNTLIEIEPGNAESLWYRLLPATLSKNWEVVKDSCGKIGLDINYDKPFDQQEFGGCRIRFDNDEDIYYARRTGPVTAEVRGICNVEQSQRYGQTVVFDPTPLNTLDQKDEDGNVCDSEGYYTSLYNSYKLVDSSSYLCFDIDGVMPNQVKYEALVSELSELGFVFEKRSSEEYIIEYPNEEGGMNELLGLYAYVLVPSKKNMPELHQVLSRFSGQLDHPLIWPRLAESLGLDDELSSQSEIEDKYNL